MITAITKLNGIGTLHAPLISGALNLRKKVVVYGENGCGKTTLVALLRSLATGETAPLRQRQSIRGVNPQHAQILINRSPYELNGGKWNKTHPYLLFFDAAFIENNVYAGTIVGPDNRRNLLGFALGEEGVKLARKVDQLALEISSQRKVENDAKEKVQAFIKGTMSPERFSKLDPPNERAEEELEAKKRTADALRQASTLRELQNLSPIPFEEVSLRALTELLNQTLETISREAESRIRAHIDATHATEEWISQGTTFDPEGICPYCAQDLQKSDIASVYGTYFSATYREYKESLRAGLEALELSYGPQKQASLRLITEGNKSRLLQWKTFLPDVALPFDLQRALAAIESARKALRSVAEKKMGNPLESISLTPEELESINGISPIATEVDDYNAAQVTVNAAIEKLRNSVQSGDLGAVEEEIAVLENRILRYSELANAACVKFANATTERERLEKEKADARENLDLHTTNVLSKYKDAINVHLKACGTSFVITTLKTSYQAGIPRCEYAISLFDVPVDLSNKPASPVVFESALSQGDKNALAFAFFLARLEADPGRAEQIVVFDDPLSSLDSRRRGYTRKKIAELSGEVAQTIILTHEEATVADVSKRLVESECTLLKLRAQGDYSVFATTTVKEITAIEYVKCFDNLSHFLHGQGKPEDVVKDVRPYLEMNLRYRFPDEFGTESLGKMIGQIRASDKSKPLWKLAPILKDLESVNDFCTRHSHGDSALVNAERILASELKPIVDAALEISRGFPTISGR
jgi:wobble nucleotide-excising tRNase